jgi:hypothetical protein
LFEVFTCRVFRNNHPLEIGAYSSFGRGIVS